MADQADPDEVAGEGGRALVLPVRADLYAVALDEVRLVLEAPAIARLPGAGNAWLGVVNVRGEVVGVLDTAVAAGVGALRAAPFAAVVETPAGPIALACSDAPESTVLDDALGPSDLQVAVERRRAGTRAVTVLDPAALLGAAGGPR
jgi:chemotaxis signal transduction protein